MHIRDVEDAVPYGLTHMRDGIGAEIKIKCQEAQNVWTAFCFTMDIAEDCSWRGRQSLTKPNNREDVQH